MNSRTIFRVTLLSALFATASAFATSTISSARVDSLRIALNRVTVPEMPAKASQLVANVMSHPALSNFDLKERDILPEFCAITRAPVGKNAARPAV